MLQLKEMPLFLERTALGVPRATLQRPPDDGGQLALVEHLWHLRDCEADLYMPRIRRVLTEEVPHLPGVAVGGWPDERGYLQRDGDSAVHEFIGLRRETIALLKDLDIPSLSRIGQRFDGVAINVLGLVEQLAEHDRDHRWRMAALLRRADH